VEGDLSESTLLDYVRFQSSQQPQVYRDACPVVVASRVLVTIPIARDWRLEADVPAA
jgi:hypothetical protein